MSRIVLGVTLFLAVAGAQPSVPQISYATISVRTLSHKPPKAARRELERGMRDWDKGREAEAGPRFARAVVLDPEYAGAHAMLGVQRAKSGQLDLALQSFERAVELEPSISDFQANMAMLLIGMHRFTEAEPFARRATRLLPGSAYARFALGLALVGQEKATPEAAASLRAASEQYPTAAAALQWVEARQAGAR